MLLWLHHEKIWHLVGMPSSKKSSSISDVSALPGWPLGVGQEAFGYRHLH